MESPIRSQKTKPVRGFVFWSLAPFLLIFLVLMPFLIPKNDASAIIGLTAVELLVGLVFLGLFDPSLFWWAWRGVGAIVFLGYVVYFVSMLIESGGHIAYPTRKSEPTAFNALCGLVLFGLPGLCYAVFGRLTFRKPDQSNEFADDEDAC